MKKNEKKHYIISYLKIKNKSLKKCCIYTLNTHTQQTIIILFKLIINKLLL